MEFFKWGRKKEIKRKVREETKRIGQVSENNEKEDGKDLPFRFPDEDSRIEINKKINFDSFAKKIESKDLFFDHSGTLESLARLVFELRDKLPTYDTVLSDDAGGRIPALILKQIIDRKKENKNSKIYFLASGRHHNEKINKLIDEFIKKKHSELGKTLLVTEFISSGGSISKLVDALESKNVNFDLAAVSIENSPHDNYSKKIQRHLYYGGENYSGLSFYGTEGHKHAGVVKDLDVASPHPVKAKGYANDRDAVESARNDIKITANELSKLLE